MMISYLLGCDKISISSFFWQERNRKKLVVIIPFFRPCARFLDMGKKEEKAINQGGCPGFSCLGGNMSESDALFGYVHGRTQTLTISPTFSTSEGCLIYQLQIWEICQPVLVYADIHKAPKSMTLRTVPVSGSIPGVRSVRSSTSVPWRQQGSSSQGSRPGRAISDDVLKGRDAHADAGGKGISPISSAFCFKAGQGAVFDIL